MVRFITPYRQKWLPLFRPAYVASRALRELHGGGILPVKQVDRGTAIEMLTALLGALGAKGDRDLMLGMLDMLESGKLAEAYDSETWLPLKVSAVSLALACRQLIATMPYAQLRPADLHKACREAHLRLGGAAHTCEKLIDYVRRCDALLLRFDHEEWERPYLMPEYRLILPWMLKLHDIHGDGSEAWSDHECDDDGNYVHPFAIAVQVEQTKLEAEQAKLAAESKPPPKRIAAARKRTETKRRAVGRRNR